MIKIKTDKELDHMRASGRIAATVREEVRRHVAPGITTEALDRIALDKMKDLGAKSAFYGYRGFLGNICVSINDEVVHGIPGPRRIEMGDLVSVDVGVVYDGYVGDTATTIMVGLTDPEIIRLVRVAESALDAAIEQAVAKNRLSDISHAVEKVVTKAGFSVVKDFVGHGVGKEMHEDPQIPNFGPPGRGPRLKRGMVFALEPMVNLGGPGVKVMDDGWTVLTRDRKPSVHVEHTVVIQDDSAEILTRVEENV